MEKLISFKPYEYLDTTNGEWVKIEPEELILPKFESKIRDIKKIAEDLYLVIPHNYFESYLCRALIIEEVKQDYTHLQQFKIKEND